MKRIIALLMVVVLALCGCSSESKVEQQAVIVSEKEVKSTDDGLIHVVVGDDEEEDDSDYVYSPEFDNIGDDELLSYVKENLYLELVHSLPNEDYFIEDVSTVYVSQEYIDELSYNSKPNIYFGFTLEELDETFQGTRYVFTLGEEGNTVVKPFEKYDDTLEQVIKNVAIGTGVILICVTASAVSAGAAAPAISLVFATAAKTGTTMALSSALMGGVSSGIITGIQTGDMEQALKAAELAASDGFKWGAISGVVSGGISTGSSYAKAMKSLANKELYISKQEAAAIQMQTGFSPELLSEFHSVEEYNVFQQAGLKAQMINGKTALVRDDIDLYKIVDEMGRNNLTRMNKGLAPIGVDKAGKVFKYELHHIGQEADATLAILTTAEHDNPLLHTFKSISEINRNDFGTTRKHFWKSFAKRTD